MTAGQLNEEPKTAEAALAECAALIGRQFSKTAVAALIKLHGLGQLGGSPAAERRLTAA
jgi:hypothetical protein